MTTTITEADHRKKLDWTVENIWNKFQWDLADQAYTDDVVLYSPHAPKPLHGREGIHELVSLLHKAYPDFHVKVDDVLVQGDKAALRFTVSGTDTGGSFGFPPSGKTFAATEMEFVRFAEDGRIAEVRFNINLMDVMGQLGLVPPGPPPRFVLALIGFTQKLAKLKPGRKREQESPR